MKVGPYTLHPHTACAHFTIALYPAALFFLALSFYYRPEECRFAYYYLLLLADLSVPAAYVTGVVEWKQKYRGYRTRTFLRKIRCSLAAGVLGLGCAAWYALFPESATGGGVLQAAFLACNAAILPIVFYAGYLGGKLVFGGAH